MNEAGDRPAQMAVGSRRVRLCSGARRDESSRNIQPGPTGLRTCWAIVGLLFYEKLLRAVGFRACFGTSFVELRRVDGG